MNRLSGLFNTREQPEMQRGEDEEGSAGELRGGMRRREKCGMREDKRGRRGDRDIGREK